MTRTNYRAGVIIIILFILAAALVLGLIFGLNSADKDAKISALQVSNAHFETELMGLMMTSLTLCMN